MTAPIFPFRPNWKPGILERLEFLALVIPGVNGTEQRHGRGRTKPRRLLEFELLADGHESQMLEAFLWKYRASDIRLPIPTDRQRLGAPLSSGASSIPCRTVGYDFSVGGEALLQTDYLAYEAVEIAAVNADSVDLAAPTTLDWPAHARLAPMREARLAGKFQQSRRNAGVVEGKIQAHIVPSEYTPTETPVQYQGIDCLLERPDWSGGIDVVHDSDVRAVDGGVGPIYQRDVTGLEINTRTLNYWLEGREALAAWRGFFYARGGRRRSFYVPTQQHDLYQSAACSSVSSDFKVRSVGYSTHYNLADGRRDIALLHRNGTVYLRRITSAETVGSDDVLTLNAPLGISTNPGDFKKISWLSLSRLDADAIELSWRTSAFATTVFDVVGVQQ